MAQERSGGDAAAKNLARDIQHTKAGSFHGMKVGACSQVSAPPSAPACDDWAQPTPGVPQGSRDVLHLTERPVRPSTHPLKQPQLHPHDE